MYIKIKGYFLYSLNKLNEWVFFFIEVCELGGWFFIWKGFWLYLKVVRMREIRYFFVLKFYFLSYLKFLVGVEFGFVLFMFLREMVEDELVWRYCYCGFKRKIVGALVLVEVVFKFKD